jgi:hypothetical protein
VEKSKFSFALITYPTSKYSLAQTKGALNELKLQFKVYQSDQVTKKNVSVAKCLLFFFLYFHLRKRYANYLRFSFEIRNNLIVLIKSIILVIISGEFRSATKVAIARCQNISTNHLKAWSESYQSKDVFLIVLEDDADAIDHKENINSIAEILRMVPRDKLEYIIMDLSDSYSIEELGLRDNILYTTRDDRYQSDIIYLKSAATNTLCAVLFGSETIRQLISFVSNSGQKYIKCGIPIDWVVNAWLTYYPDDIPPLVSIHVKPGYFKQMSMKS